MRWLTPGLRGALRDYRLEALLSACTIISTAAMLAPVLILLGVRHGLVTAMTKRLLENPQTLELIPVGSGQYSFAWFEGMRAKPETDCIIPQTRSIAAVLKVVNPAKEHLAPLPAAVFASGEGDPLLKKWITTGTVYPGWQPAAAMQGLPASAKETVLPAIIVSHSVAQKLQLSVGQMLRGEADRIRNGKVDVVSIHMPVLAVLPAAAQPTDRIFVPLELLVAMENFRDGYSVPFLGWHTGVPYVPGVAQGQVAQTTPSPPVQASTLEEFSLQMREYRDFSSFRLYAKTLDDVARLEAVLTEQNISVSVEAGQIEAVKNIDQALGIIFSLITLATMGGFVASSASNALAAVKRKSRHLGVMRLLGFSRSEMLIFPLVQSTLSSLLGTLLALCIYLVVSHSIDYYFASKFASANGICILPPLYVLVVAVAVVALSLLSSFTAAIKASSIEPSEVIRDV